MHILIVPQSYPGKTDNLAGVFFQEQARSLQRQGIKTGIIVIELLSLRKWQSLKRIHEIFRIFKSNDQGCALYRLVLPNIFPAKLRFNFVLFYSTILYNKYTHENGKPDLIHAHCTHWAGGIASKINNSNSIPYVLTEHSSSFLNNRLSLWQKNLTPKILNKASRVIAVSPSLAKAVNNYAPNISVEVLPNSVADDFFNCKKNNTDFPIITSIANHTKNKSTETLIKSLPAILEIFPNAIIEIYGPGNEIPNLKKLTKLLKISENVKFIGEVDQKGVLDALANSAVLVVSSLHETFSVILAEAIATGTNVVSTRCGGPEYILSITHPKSDRLVSVNSPKEMASKVIEVLSTDTNMEREYARHIAMDKFSNASLSKRLIKIYNSITNA